MTAAPGRDAAGDGFVVPSFPEGSLFLETPDGLPLRLEWGPEDATAKDRRRALPPATYTLTGYRVVRRTEDGHVWFVSATSRGMREFSVNAGQETRVEIDETIRFELRGHRRHGEIDVQMRISGEEGAGLTIYKDGKRIPIGYALDSSDGRRLSTGEMEYG
ncbi:MAG: hypothetical protein HY720_25250 [Planctomycetes bacterium]|nr:hypothetical protein [Planctomycetota bacterium]